MAHQQEMQDFLSQISQPLKNAVQRVLLAKILQD